MNIKFGKNRTVLSADDVFSVMQTILCRENKIDRDKEHFWIIGLNTRKKILFIELVCIGGLRSAKVEPMNIFRVAVLKGAHNVILVHNHPSGELDPSHDDEDITDRLIQIGKILEIEVFDHLILSTKAYLSFFDKGILTRLEEDSNWMPPYKIAEKIRAEADKIRKEANRLRKISVIAARKEGLKAGEEKGIKKGEKKRELEIAKKLIKKGTSVKEISAITGLTPKVIKGLK